MSLSSLKPLVIGIGNRFRGDDGLGLFFLDFLKQQPQRRDQFDFLESQGEPSHTLSHWMDRSLVIIIDAYITLGPIGVIKVWDGFDLDLPFEQATASSHHMSLKSTIALGQTLQQIPKSLKIIGISANAFKLEEPINPVLVDLFPTIESTVLALTQGQSTQ